jgi:ATP-dependent DNA ligase
MGLAKRRPLWVDQPTITGRTHPAPDPRSPLFACLCRSMLRTQTAGLSAFFLETEARGASGDWIHEIKLDGFRMMVRRDGAEAEEDWTR